MSIPTTILALLDKADAGYKTAEALARQARWAEMTALLTAAGDLTFILKLATALQSSQAQTAPDAINFAAAQPLLQALDNAYLLPLGWATLDAYLTVQNAAPFTALVGPNAAYLVWLYRSNGSKWRGKKTPTLLMTPGNVFAPVTALGTATVGAGGAVTFTDGAAIRTTNDTTTGIQGYTPAPGVLATVTTPVNGTLTVQVTYNGLNAAGGAVTGRHGTLVLDGLGVGATATMTLQAAGDRISDVTALAATGSPTATAGAFGLASVLERVTA